MTLQVVAPSLGKGSSMHSKILVPLDGSKIAEVALDQARKMASSDGVEVRLLQASRKTATASSPKEYLDGLCEELTKEELHCSSIVVDGGAVEGILSVANDENVDLIVMTSRGRSGVARLVLGSVAEEVVRKAPCPVLVLGHEYLERLSKSQ